MPSGTTAIQQLRCSVAIARKDLRIYYSKGPVLILGLLFPGFMFFAFIIGRDLSIEFMMPGLLGMILFFTATAISPMVVPWETMTRTLERLMCCPVWTSTIIIGDILASFILGLVSSLVPIIITLALGGTISSPLILTLAIILGAFCFASLGNLFAIPSFNLPMMSNMIATLVKFPLLFISGIFISLDELPTWGQAIAYISPLTYFTDVARHCIGGQGHIPVVIDLIAILAFSTVFITLDVKLLSRTMHKRI